jgi:ELWxxDGT repeat protein
VTNGRLWFFAAADRGEEPWVTDGTPAGTRPLGDLNPGAASSIVGGYPGPAHEPFFVAGPDGYVYFQATTAAEGTELFRSDGTAAGTGLVADFVPGTGDSIPGPFLTVGGRLFVAANNPVYGREWHLIASGPAAPDPNRDGRVDFADLVVVAQHYNQTGMFAEGDFNGDGKVDFGDLVLLAQRYNTVLPAAGGAGAVAAVWSGGTMPSLAEVWEEPAKKGAARPEFSPAPVIRPKPARPGVAVRRQ